MLVKYYIVVNDNIYEIKNTIFKNQNKIKEYE